MYSYYVNMLLKIISNCFMRRIRLLQIYKWQQGVGKEIILYTFYPSPLLCKYIDKTLSSEKFVFYHFPTLKGEMRVLTLITWVLWLNDFMVLAFSNYNLSMIIGTIYMYNTPSPLHGLAFEARNTYNWWNKIWCNHI